ncbi:FG-GAP-like repeat-containing protein [Stieleria sp. TO1_6]|uniref:beta strand repeat-containing protein n=1 Tax=Stieleria tagensis TaxID=2956795 RepID=UPI00209AF045|nr:FG-GAP-like repeat-containing protein [Stieleria tagensis]MCO8124697.1 FG-GAP-like repeat-containing protein [Stieleria tagensis]
MPLRHSKKRGLPVQLSGTLRRRRRVLLERLETRQLLAGDMTFADSLPTAEEAEYGNAVLTEDGRAACLAFKATSLAEGELPAGDPEEAPGDVDLSVSIVQPPGPLAPGSPLTSTITFENAGPQPADASDLQVAFDAGLTGITWQREVFQPSPALVTATGLDGDNGFSIPGDSGSSLSGTSVSGIGDVNDDGIDDIAIGAAVGDLVVVFGSSAGFGANFDVTSLDGSNGFRVTGTSGNALVADGAGDVNGDGIDDLIIGDSFELDSGQAFVIFGQSTFASAVDASALNGTTGFSISGINSGDGLGSSVSGAGDINGDGIADIVVGASNAKQSSAPAIENTGEAYVIFGKDTAATTLFPAAFDLTTLNGGNGFVVQAEAAGDLLGAVVDNAGDVNGDTIDDLLITAPGNPTSTTLGAAYVLYGQDTGFGANLALAGLSSSNGFKIAGIRSGQALGSSASGLGDINGDGFDDLVIAEAADAAQALGGAQGYVVLGHNNTTGSFDLTSLVGSNGFTFVQSNSASPSPLRVSEAGDINGDGLDDLLVGAAAAQVGSSTIPGGAFAVYGTDSGFAAAITLADLDGNNGFRFEGEDVLGNAGDAVGSAGDINGDGLADVIVGAPFAAAIAGESYVVFGRGSTFTAGSGAINQTVDIDAGGRVIYHVDATIAAGPTETVVDATAAGSDDNTPGNNTASATTLITAAAAPTVSSIQINDGSASRSQITSITVTFDSIVNETEVASAFSISQIDDNVDVGIINADVDSTSGVTIVTLTFDGTSTVSRLGTGPLGNSLADGNYLLTIDTSKVLIGSVPMDANDPDRFFGGNVAADVLNDDFFRLLGDANGDGFRNGIDLNQIIPTLFSTINYRADLDTNGDGASNGIDLNALIPTLFGSGRL